MARMWRVVGVGVWGLAAGFEVVIVVAGRHHDLLPSRRRSQGLHRR